MLKKIFHTPKIKIDLQKNQPTPKTKQQMWSLYQQSYQTTEGIFYSEMEQYDLYAFFRKKGEMIGFVGIQMDRSKINHQEYLLVRFGQAIIQEAHRGSFLIPRTAMKLSFLFWKEVLAGKLLFWANALTYKSYLVVAKSMDTFYPNYQQPTPYQVKEIIDFIGANQFKENYEKQLGIVKSDTCQIDDTSSRLCFKYKEDPDIRFFTEVNPKHEKGHGLITLTPMNRKNIWSLIKKYKQHFYTPNFQQKLQTTKFSSFNFFPC